MSALWASSRPRDNRTTHLRKTTIAGVAILLVTGAITFGLAATSGTASPQRAIGAQPRGVPAHPSTDRLRTSRTLSPPPHAIFSAPGKLILDRNLPDPAVLDVRGRYYLYSSQTGFDTPPASLTESRGSTLFHWNKTGTALATVPSWAETGFTWAPDVRRIDGRYVMYFNAWANKSMYFEPSENGFSQRAQCIGIASAKNPAGPFTPLAHSPLVCQFNHHGAIDPRTFEAPDGRLYLDWKSDDNADPGHPPTHLWAQELSNNGLEFVGARYLLMSGSRQIWNGGLIEAPDMVYANHKYWLFYSGSWFNTPGYAIGVAKCSRPVGPCQTISTRPWLTSNSQGAGPGEESLFHNPQGWWMVYNPWSLYARRYRSVEIARVFFGPSGPYLAKFSI
ncbi:MAG: glycoside hydrolase family 43 protein [Acidimicrobiales bacterium]